MNIDLKSFSTGFPAQMPCPPLVLEFGQWVKKKISYGELGYFEQFSSEPLDESYLSDDRARAVIREQLGIFLRLPDGAQLALWRRGAKPPAVVLLGLGELENVAPDFGSFLWALSEQKTGVSDLDDPEASEKRAALAQWLTARGIPRGKAKIPSFREWFDATVEKNRAPAKPAPLEAGPAPLDLIERVDALIGRTIDDPEVLALARELGFDLPSIGNADELKELARPEEGFSLNFAWPWEYNNPELNKKFPQGKRAKVKRMLWGITVYADGHQSWSRGKGGYNSYRGFRGSLPKQLSFKDKPAAARKKLGKLHFDDHSMLMTYDAKRDVLCHVDFASESDGKIKKGSMTSLCVRRRMSPM